jgi:hypothetical protein
MFGQRHQLVDVAAPLLSKATILSAARWSIPNHFRKTGCRSDTSHGYKWCNSKTLVRHTPNPVARHASLEVVRLENQWPAMELSVLGATDTNATQAFAVGGNDFKSTVLRNQSCVLQRNS